MDPFSGMWAAAVAAILVAAAAAWALTRALRRANRERARAEAERRRLASIVDSTEEAVYVIDSQGRLTSWNPAAEALYGYAAAEVVGRHLSLLFRPDRVSEEANLLMRVLDGERIERYETAHRRRDGSAIEMSITASPLCDRRGRLGGAALMAHDVSGRVAAERALRDAEERFRAAFEHAPIGMALVSVAPGSVGRFLQVNRALCEITGYGEGELLARDFQSITHPDDLDADLARFDDLLAGRIAHYRLEKRYVGPDGREAWISLGASLVRDGAGAPLHVVAQMEDISERKRFEAELTHMADHDALTGLLNRRRFEGELQRQVAYTRRYGGSAALLAVDLDGFKALNDSGGHAAGDRLLARLGEELRATLRETDVVARIGGDEFAVILPAVDAAGARTVADKLARVVRETAGRLPGAAAARVTASVGIAPIVPGGGTAAEVMRDADLRMYAAKRAGGDRAAGGPTGVTAVA